MAGVLASFTEYILMRPIPGLRTRPRDELERPFLPIVWEKTREKTEIHATFGKDKTNFSATFRLTEAGCVSDYFSSGVVFTQ